MTQQFLRACSLIVGNASGQGLDLSTLRIDFTVTHATVQTPKVLSARISNVSRATAGTVQQEFTRVILSAGYQGALGKLFDGQIRQTRFGRENPTDTYLDIIAADGDQAYSQGFISQTLAAGWTAGDVAREIASSASGLGLTMGTPPPDTGQAGIRPKVMFGPIRDHARVLATSTGTSWGISDGALNFAELDVAAHPSQQAAVLSPSTGLIGIPRQTIDGLEATCLLNPQITAGSYVKIDTALIAQAQVETGYGGVNGGNLVGSGSQQSVAGLSPSGVYRVVFVDHYGDTRGDSWYSTLSCYADDGNAVQSNANLTAVP